jgi:hypothetical protein
MEKRLRRSEVRRKYHDFSEVWMSVVEIGNLAISLVALALAATTLWLTQFRRGQLLMGRPQQIYIGGDGDGSGPPKVFIKSLLYSTAHNGQFVENIFARIVRTDHQQTFPIWVYGDQPVLRRNGGLFVPREGISTSHHFILSSETASYNFGSGDYVLEIHASIVGRNGTQLLQSAKLSLTEGEAEKLGRAIGGIYFDWGPESQSYSKKYKAATAH